MIRLRSEASDQAFPAATFPHFAACFITIGAVLIVVGCIFGVLASTAKFSAEKVRVRQEGSVLSTISGKYQNPNKIVAGTPRSPLSSEAAALFAAPWVLPAVVFCLFMGMLGGPKRRR